MLDVELGEGQRPANGAVARKSSADENEATTTSTSALSPSEISAITSAAKKSIAPAPPQWRFVNQARKSTGYSSLSAGFIVKGKSSQELGAKYVAPEISYAENIEKSGGVGELSAPEIAFQEFDKEQQQVGELSVPELKYSEFDKGQQEVGKLSIDESAAHHEEMFEVEPHKPIVDSLESQKEENIEHSPMDLSTTYDMDLSTSIDSESKDDNSTDDPRKRRKRKFFLMLLPLLIVILIVGAVLGRKKTSPDEEHIIRAFTEVTVIHNSTNQPSTLPSANPSAYPSSYHSHGLFDEQHISTASPTTYRPTLMPTREPSLTPTPSPSLTPTPSPSGKPSYSPTFSPSTKEPTSSPSNHPVTSPPTKQPIVFLGYCPDAFAPLSFYLIGAQVQLEGIVYECISSSCGSDGYEPWAEGWEVVGSCSGTITSFTISTSTPTRRPTPQPSRAPTKHPSREPTMQPITMPTRTPSKAPSQEPSVRPTPEPTSEPTSKPSVQPSKQPIMEPTYQPTASPTYEPSYSPTLEPTFEPSPKPSKQPSRQPTPLPSWESTPEPTNLPEASSACAKNGNFNLCVAIDMSGSVCNGNSGSACLGCYPTESCNSGGNNLSVCCSNFDNMLEFTRNLVTSLGELDTNQDFSIVHFGTEVAIASTLDSWRQSVKTINKLKYSGGGTNLAGAISSCQETLASSPPDRKNLMLVITDGAPSVPEFGAEEAAADAATNAKDQDTFIIPVFIEEGTAQSPELSFLRNSISSDGEVFTTSFADLVNLQVSISNQITCKNLV